MLAGVVHTGLAYTLYFGSLTGLPAQSAALISYIDPLTAVVLSVTVLHEPMTWPLAVGAVLILGGALLGEIPLRKKEK